MVPQMKQFLAETREMQIMKGSIDKHMQQIKQQFKRQASFFFFFFGLLSLGNKINTTTLFFH